VSAKLTIEQRVFSYADGTAWVLNVIAFIAAIAAGTILPLMDLIFGKFITIAVGFARGTTTPAQYRSEINKYT
jgi:ATP-binding cassette, subfamily B (MDR/TAP), member 1